MPLEVNEIGIVMRVKDGPEPVVQLEKGGWQPGERREAFIAECVRRVLQALKMEQER